eukprot:4551608-Alexandrium_andersonii.AAC.1
MFARQRGGAQPPGDARTCWGSGCATAGSVLEAAGKCWKLLETAERGVCPLSLALCSRPGVGCLAGGR